MATPLIEHGEDRPGLVRPAFVDGTLRGHRLGFQAYPTRQDRSEGRIRSLLRLSNATIGPRTVVDAGFERHITNGASGSAGPGENYRGRSSPLPRHSRAQKALEQFRPGRASHRDTGLLALTSAAAGCGSTSARTTPSPPRVQHLRPHRETARTAATRLRHRSRRRTAPATLGSLGGIRTSTVEALRRRAFPPTGIFSNLYHHHGIDANAIIDAAEEPDG